MKNAKPTFGFTNDRSETENRHPDRSDWVRVRAMTDAEVEATVATERDETGMIVDWTKATLVAPDRKKTMTIRLDSDLLDFYRDMGRGYQTTINAVLRSYMRHGKG